MDGICTTRNIFKLNVALQMFFRDELLTSKFFFYHTRDFDIMRASTGAVKTPCQFLGTNTINYF